MVVFFLLMAVGHVHGTTMQSSLNDHVQDALDYTVSYIVPDYWLCSYALNQINGKLPVAATLLSSYGGRVANTALGTPTIGTRLTDLDPKQVIYV
jgi:hypothetical protein